MVSITLSVDEEFKSQLKSFSWVNWSEIAREETQKKLIYEKFIKTRKISPEDWVFCEKIDWHPVDELPIKKEYLEKLKKIRKTKALKVNSVDEIFK